MILDGGEGGIRTHERIAPLRDFQSRLFGHSSTSPKTGVAHRALSRWRRGWDLNPRPGATGNRFSRAAP